MWVRAVQLLPTTSFVELPALVQMGLQKKEIDMGHARALLSLDSPSLQLKLYREILKNGYSVRKVEELCQQLNNGEDIQSAKKKISARTRLPEEFNIPQSSDSHHSSIRRYR